MALWRICLVFTAATNSAEGNENTGSVMPTIFLNVLETSKLRIRWHYLDSDSYVLLHFLTLRFFENLAPGEYVPMRVTVPIKRSFTQPLITGKQQYRIKVPPNRRSNSNSLQNSPGYRIVYTAKVRPQVVPYILNFVSASRTCIDHHAQLLIIIILILYTV